MMDMKAALVSGSHVQTGFLELKEKCPKGRLPERSQAIVEINDIDEGARSTRVPADRKPDQNRTGCVPGDDDCDPGPIDRELTGNGAVK
jgi:hypothetical protein